ncbi:MAG: hypothetical protein V2I46_02960 [Bacteroides sp.]|jgi:hypothetical protein|nr:hypothetical protein [Bacteroides sp.]
MEQNTVKNTQAQKRKKFPFRVNSKRYLTIIAVFTVIGVAGGFAYYWFVGCKTGGCAITSSPYMSMVWGGMVGYLIPDFFVKKEAGE